MKIAFCLPGNDWGGINREPVRTLTSALRGEQGLEIFSVALSSAVSAVTSKEGNILVPSRKSVGWCMLDGYRQERRVLADELRALSPDIVHVHWTQMGHALGALDSGLPLVVTAHDAALTCAFWNWSWHPGAALSCARGVEFTRQVLRGASRVIAVSPYVKRHIETVFLEKKNGAVEVIPNPVAVDAPSLADSPPVPEEGAVFIAIGHWGPLKRFDLALRAFGEVVRQLPGARFLLVGKGLGEQGPAHRWAAGRGLDHGVSFIGQCAHEDIMGLLSGPVHCLLHPSRSEGFGLAVAEAMKCGVPVITSGAGALPWLLEEGRAGEIVRGSSPSAWSEAMIRVTVSRRSGDKVGAMRDHARERIHDLCNPAAVAARHLEIYESVLAQ